MPQIIDHVFNGVLLNEVHRHEVKVRVGADKHHQEVMKFVDFIENTNSLLDKEAEIIMNPTTDCITVFFNQNPNVRSASFLYMADKTASALLTQGVKLHKREIFEVIPYPRERDDPNSPEYIPKPEFYIRSELINHFYDYFLKEFSKIRADFSRSSEIINRPRIIGLTKFKCEEKLGSTFSNCCAILDNFILYIYPQLADSSDVLEIDLRFVYNVTLIEAKRTQGDFFSTEHVIKIDYFKPHENTFPVLKLQFGDETEMLHWKKLLSDWINVTQSPLLHRQPMERHFSGMFCNYAVAILIGEKLITPIFTTENKKQWLLSSIDQLPEKERNFVNDFSFKCDMPRQPSSIDSHHQFSKLTSPAAFLQLLIKFTKDHLMVPARFIHKIQSSESNQSLVAAGLDSVTSTLSRNYSEVSDAVNSLSIAYKNTLMEIFWYFKVLVKNSDIAVEELVEWLAVNKFCNGLFSCETMTNMIDFFEDFFQVEENFAKQREKQFELIKIQLERIPNRTSTMQVLFIRHEWLKYKLANDSEYENLLEPIKLTNPPDFTRWTYGDLVEELYKGIQGSSGKQVKAGEGSGTYPTSASSNESLDSVIDSENHTYLLVERLTYNKHVIRILPYSCHIDPQVLPMSVLMQCRDFLLAFQMLVLLQKGKRDTVFDVDYAKLKWDSKEKRPDKSEKRFSMVPMVLSVDVNCAKLQKRSSSGNAATASTNDSASSSSGGVSLCLSHFDLYFGSVSSKTAKLKQYMKDKTVDKEKWKRSLSLIGDNHCHIFTFDQPPVMLSCFWSLQHAKLGPNGVEEWIPNHKMNNLNQRCRPGQSNAAGNRTGTTSSGRDITGGAQRSSGDSFASQGSLGGVVSYVNTNGRDSCADQLSATDDEEYLEMTDGVTGRMPTSSGSISHGHKNGRDTGTLTGPSSAMSSSSSKKGKGIGRSSGISKSMDMLQDSLSSLPVTLSSSPAANERHDESAISTSGFVEKETKRGAASRISILQKPQKALKKQFNF
ncbi:uncharacterized protein LOC142349752 isoform X3 [Convolutriloba macropyga]|uniref:uncharacterized protein LOC142349752 isoform X3 n=1 Tax=Convolutriloba macropyga TaxID=536237 RepID=UPI003F525DBF